MQMNKKGAFGYNPPNFRSKLKWYQKILNIVFGAIMVWIGLTYTFSSLDFGLLAAKELYVIVLAVFIFLMRGGSKFIGVISLLTLIDGLLLIDNVFGLGLLSWIGLSVPPSIGILGGVLAVLGAILILLVFRVGHTPVDMRLRDRP